MEHQYEDRYVAFIDILGFSSLVNRAEYDNNLLKRLVSVLEEQGMYSKLETIMEDLGSNDPKGFYKNMFRVSTFSDNIVISTKNNLIGLPLITIINTGICIRLLHQGIFTRGAIVKGKLIHTNTIVLGAGLIRAHKLEKTAAIYPRILLDEIVVHEMDSLLKHSKNPDLRRQDFDGLWHLHIFHPIVLEMASHTSDSYISLNHDICRQEIERVLHSSGDDLPLKAKIGWLAKYFNEYVASSDSPEIKVND